jgi:single-strand DNA-binding protein
MIELKQTPSGKLVANFTLAVRRPFTKDITDFFPITVWDKQAEFITKYVGKGDMVCLRGHLTNRSWEDQQGSKHSITEVVASEVCLCGAKVNSEGNNTTKQENGSQREFDASKATFAEMSQDQDLPF